MNLDRVQPSLALISQQLKPVGQRLDVTVASSAMPGKDYSAASAVEAPQIGSIPGVLIPEENQAIAALFGPVKGVYTAVGETRQHQPPLGTHLDIQV